MTRLLEAMATRFHGKVLLECGLVEWTVWVAPVRALTPRRELTTEYLPTFMAKLLIRMTKTPIFGCRTFRKPDLALFFVHQDKGSYLDE